MKDEAYSPSDVSKARRSSADAALVEKESGDENKERGNWTGQLDFLLSCLGYAVGLGNVWRFPYICYRNGGGAFFIPYLIMLLFVGLPIFYLELSLGQFASLGPIKLFGAIAPLFQGIGYAMVMTSSLVALYYNVIISWTLYYMFASFQKVLPWSTCTNTWNTDDCWSKAEESSCEDVNGTYYQTVCYTNLSAEDAELYKWKSINASSLRISASEEFYKNKMLGLTGGIGDVGEGVKWDLALTLLGAWVIVYLCLIKGIKSSGKVVYFTATFPYVVLVILLIRGVTLEGAGEGIKFFISPKIEILKSPQVWVDAAGQIFFSLGVAFGGIMTLASYNRFHNNCLRDSIIVSFGNCGTSIFAGFVIFSILGHMAWDLDKDVGEVVKSGSGLAFVAYPTVLSRLPVGQLWSVLFFFMLLTLGLDSQFAMLETVVTAVLDSWPRARKKKHFVSLAVSIVLYLLALPMCTGAGLFWTDLMNTFAASWSLILVALGEGIVIPWVYGVNRFTKDIALMIGCGKYQRVGNYFWYLTLLFTTPLLILGILIFNFVYYEPPKSEGIPFPGWAIALGWIITAASIILIPAVAIINTIRYVNKRIPSLIRPHPNWGPALDKHRTGDYKPLVGERELDETPGKPPPYFSVIPGDAVYHTPSSGYGPGGEGCYNPGFEPIITKF